MFSNWFSGDECGQYRTSLYKRRMDQVGSRLLELRYANDVIRQHLHEWLRFSRHIEERGLLCQAPVTNASSTVMGTSVKVLSSRSKLTMFCPTLITFQFAPSHVSTQPTSRRQTGVPEDRESGTTLFTNRGCDI